MKTFLWIIVILGVLVLVGSLLEHMDERAVRGTQEFLEMKAVHILLLIAGFFVIRQISISTNRK